MLGSQWAGVSHRLDAARRQEGAQRMHDRTLTDSQRCLVEENLGLVAVHLRRHVRGLHQPRRDREWQDLFQEGCIGLARAAAAYEAKGQMPFAAFALPRIQAAVNQALRRAFETVHIPESAKGKAQPGGSRPRVVSLDVDPAVLRPRVGRNPYESGAGDTIAEHVRRKYCEAVDRATTACKAIRTQRDDRSELIDRVARDRLSVPEETERVALRQIARETGSSYARVVHAEKRLLEHMRAALSTDAELAQLRAEARRNTEGMDAPMDPQTRLRVSMAGAGGFERLFSTWPASRRGAALMDLLVRCGENVEHLVRSLFSRLASDERTEFVATWSTEK